VNVEDIEDVILELSWIPSQVWLMLEDWGSFIMTRFHNHWVLTFVNIGIFQVSF